MAFVPTTSEETRQWLLRFHSVNDSLDPQKLPTIYAQNASMRFGNAPVLQGLEALQHHFASTWPGLDSMHHEIDEFGVEKGLISGAEFYMDPAPLIAAFTRVG
ncbi:hypothetical protein G7054_g6261 [Neopestalotiopsis clavispora]|nr:hypothetical protein G7054_g6261 [Neopestalotiopsis clavispora]